MLDARSPRQYPNPSPTAKVLDHAATYGKQVPTGAHVAVLSLPERPSLGWSEERTAAWYKLRAQWTAARKQANELLATPKPERKPKRTRNRVPRVAAAEVEQAISRRTAPVVEVSPPRLLIIGDTVTVIRDTRGTVVQKSTLTARAYPALAYKPGFGG